MAFLALKRLKHNLLEVLKKIQEFRIMIQIIWIIKKKWNNFSGSVKLWISVFHGQEVKLGHYPAPIPD